MHLSLSHQETHGRTMSSLSRTDENLTASLLKITALENSLSAAGEKFIFMQGLRDFVSVICDFLQVRVYITYVLLAVLSSFWLSQFKLTWFSQKSFEQDYGHLRRIF